MSAYCRCGHAESSHSADRADDFFCQVKSCKRCHGFEAVRKGKTPQAAKRKRKDERRVMVAGVLHGTESPEWKVAVQRMSQHERDRILRAMQKERK